MNAKIFISLVVVFCAATSLAESADSNSTTNKYLLSGSTEGLWLVRRSDDGKTFDLLSKPASKQWRWIARELVGQPATVVAIDEYLYVLLVNPRGHLMFSLPDDSPRQGFNSDDPRWPSDAVPAAACISEKSVLVLVGRESIRKGSSPNLVTFGVFRNVATKWEHVTDLPDVARYADSKVFAAVYRGKLFVLMCTGDKNSLMFWDGKKWHNPRLGDSLITRRILAMVAIKDKLLVVHAPRPTFGPPEAKIARFDESGKLVSDVVISSDSKAVRFQAETPPLFARLADQLAMVSFDGDSQKAFLSTCGVSGQALPGSEITILSRRASDDKGEQIANYFLWTLLGATLAGSFGLRPRMPLGPFVLPKTLKPGNVAKRLAAGIVDLIPFGIAGAIFLTHYVGPEIEMITTARQMGEVLQSLRSDSLAVGVSVATTALYLLYCIIMELRFGATLGKMLFALRVVGYAGQKPNFREVLLRNLVKIVVLTGLPPLLAIPLFNRNRQRLGDMMARTTVVGPTEIPQPQGPDESDDNENES